MWVVWYHDQNNNYILLTPNTAFFLFRVCYISFTCCGCISGYWDMIMKYYLSLAFTFMCELMWVICVYYG